MRLPSALICAILIFVSTLTSAGSASAQVKIRVVDVGAGLCVIAIAPGGHSMVYDTGAGARLCGDAVDELIPDRKIDLLVLSHSDIDHIGAARRILSGNEVATIIHPGDPRDGTNIAKASGSLTGVYVTANYQARRKGSDGRRIMSGDTLPPHGGLWFEARLWAGAPIDAAHRVEWRITNTGVAAFARNSQRGGFYSPESGSRRWESLEYRGVHIAEAFLIRRADNVLVGQSEPFHVAIL